MRSVFKKPFRKIAVIILRRANKVSVLKGLIVGLMITWFLIGFLLTPEVKRIVTGTPWSAPTIESLRNPEFLGIVLIFLIGGIIAGGFKGVFRRFLASTFLMFHSLPIVALMSEMTLFNMFFPVGIYAVLCAPYTPFFVFPQTRWLLEEMKLPIGQLETVGMWLFLLGTGVFTVAFIQMLKRKRFITSGLYKVVRHPQYLGIILASVGLTLISAKIISFVALITLAFAYIWLASCEEENLQEKYGKDFSSYKRSTSFILPLLPPGVVDSLLPNSRIRKHAVFLCIYALIVTITIAVSWAQLS